MLIFKFKPILLFVLAAVLGWLVGASEFQKSMGDVKWTDVGTFFVTSIGFVIAFLTYLQWLKTKVKDDAYQSTRHYLNLVLSIKFQLLELANEYNHLVPSPGLMVESNLKTKSRIDRCNEIYSSLNKTALNIAISKEHMAFWKINLTEKGLKLHNQLLQTLSNIQLFSSCLNTNINFHHFHDSSRANELNKELQGWRDASRPFLEIHENIISFGFYGLFDIQV